VFLMRYAFDASNRPRTRRIWRMMMTTSVRSTTIKSRARRLSSSLAVITASSRSPKSR